MKIPYHYFKAHGITLHENVIYKYCGQFVELWKQLTSSRPCAGTPIIEYKNHSSQPLTHHEKLITYLILSLPTTKPRFPSSHPCIPEGIHRAKATITLFYESFDNYIYPLLAGGCMSPLFHSHQSQ
jgi:hypothetical protein